MQNIQDLKDIFMIDIPMDIEHNSVSRIIVEPDLSKAKITYTNKDELFEAFAQVRLALDYRSPLLATYYLQKELSEKEVGYAYMFTSLAMPFVKGWTYRNAIRYAGYKLVAKEVKEIVEETILISMWVEPKEQDNYFDRNIFSATAYALARSINAKVQTKFIGNSGFWRKYIELIEKFITKEPSPQLLCQIPEVLEAPYTVSVKEEPYPYFVIKER